MFGPDRRPLPYDRIDHPAWAFAGHFIVMLLLVGLIVAVVLLITRTRHPRGFVPFHQGGPWVQPGTPALDPAVATVRQRFAAGELSREEYAAMMADLGAGPPVPPTG